MEVRSLCGIEEGGEERTGRERKGAFAPEVGQLDHPPREERAWDADHAQDDLLCGQVRVRRTGTGRRKGIRCDR